MKRKMPGKAVISMMLVLVLVLSATIGVFASDYIAQDTTYEDGLTVDGSTGWNTGDGDNYLVTTHGTTVTFTNTPFQRDDDNWSNFIVETISSDSADGFTMRADAYGWTYGDGINTPSYEVSINWEWDDFATICTENTEITLTATKANDTVVVFDILFGDSGYEEIYTVTYAGGVPDELWFHVGADGGTVTINSVDYADITGVTVDSVEKTEFFYLDWLTFNGIAITASYSDGTTETFTYGGSDFVRDSDGNYICIYATCSGYEYECGQRLYDIGSYGVYFVVVDSQWSYFTSTETVEDVFTVKDIEASDLEKLVDIQEMTLDTTYSAEIDVYGGSDWFAFTPEVSGYYAFMSSDSEGYATDDEDSYYWVDPYAYVYYVTEDGYVAYYSDDDSNGDYNFMVRMYLEAGTTYYLRAYMYGSYYVGVYSVEVTEAKVITAISVAELSQKELTQWLTEFDLTGTEVTVAYSDGTTAVLTIDGMYALDEYDNYIYYHIQVEDDDEYYSYGYCDTVSQTGDLLVYVYDNYTGLTADPLTITVIPLEESEEVTDIELLDAEAEVSMTSSEITYVTFTPAADGSYYINLDYLLDEEIVDTDYTESYPYVWYDVYYFDEDGNLHWSADYEYDEEGTRIYTLTGGQTYYIKVGFEVEVDYLDEDGNYTGWDYLTDVTATVSVAVSEAGHTHTYTAPVIDWTWSDDYTSATAVLRCDTCSHTETATATGDAITSVTTDATATTDGSIVYTATVTIDGVEYTCTTTVVIPATGDTSSTPGDDITNGDGDGATGGGDDTTTGGGDDTTTGGDDDATATDSSDTDSNGGKSTNTGDVSTMAYFVIILGAAVAAAVLAKKRVNE